MALEMRDRCERCDTALSEASSARICTYECTFCVSCGDAMRDTCPNCGGELVARPRRAPAPAAERTISRVGQ
ncbi:DUF1272 domain-containing protein [Streptomyces sp. RerS4]|uniref:DUF1272 domain-containing protein n=1 Tax=Streptomyces sp. RerS4 TaxID=2942449 RepID=UPI00201BE659|nr:DUF1272 domain-containing protein [Streptomyces sp. RerS4]UQX02750.1 DUF1272 domain-containing protein [Streptomyces sp. RerS4]